MKRIICLYGGPGAGKSTMAAELFTILKKKGFDCELNREYVKEWVWEGREIKEGDQTYFFAKQSRKERQYILQGLDFIITDSPLVLTHFYGLKYDPMEQECNTSLIMLQHHHKFCQKHDYKVDHFFVGRKGTYSQLGRNQDEAQARGYDGEIRGLLGDLGIKLVDVASADEIVDHIIRRGTKELTARLRNLQADRDELIEKGYLK